MVDYARAPYVFALGRQGLGNSVQLLGTCFPVAGSIMATAAHVVGMIDEGLVIVLPKTENLNDFQDEFENNVRLIPARILKVDPVKDVALITWDGSAGAVAKLKALKDASVGEDVMVYGFPHMRTGRFIATAQKASLGAKVLALRSHTKVRHAVINIQTSHGQSGSPVYSTQNFAVSSMIVGPFVPNSESFITVAGINPTELHQTTYAVDASYIMEMLK